MSYRFPRALEFSEHNDRTLTYHFLSLQCISTLLQPILDDETPQPSTEDIKRRCLLLPGPIISFRTFKHCTSKKLRGIAEEEFLRSIRELDQYGTIVEIRPPRATDAMKLFLKKIPIPLTGKVAFAWRKSIGTNTPRQLMPLSQLPCERSFSGKDMLLPICFCRSHALTK